MPYVTWELIIGGKSTTVTLCPGSTHRLKSPIVFTAPHQSLATEGNPLGRERALIIVEGEDQAVAIKCVAVMFSGHFPRPHSSLQSGLQRMLICDGPLSRH